MAQQEPTPRSRPSDDRRPTQESPPFSDEQRKRERILFGHEVDWINGEEDTEGWLSDVRPADGNGGYFKRFGAAVADQRCTSETLIELADRGAIHLSEGKPTIGMFLGIASELEAFRMADVRVTFSGEMCGPGAPHPGIAVTGLWAIVDLASAPETFNENHDKLTEKFHALHEGYDPDNLSDEPFEWEGNLVYGSWWD